MLYVPVLKCKQGEKDALYTLSDGIKNHICPLLEVTPDIIEKDSFSGVEDFWKERPFIFDISPEYQKDINDKEYFKLLRKCNREYTIPAIKLFDNEEKISKLVGDASNGVAVRLYLEEILDDDFEILFEEFSKMLDISKTDLIISIQYVESNKVNETAFLIKSALNLITNINKFRSVIFSSNSFPRALEVEKFKLSLIPRVESIVYDKIKPYFNKKGVNLLYSDYSINHWSFFEFIPGMQPSFNIRYSTEDAYIVYKGETIKKGGLKIEKVSGGCNLLSSSPYFKGKDYSWGDNEINEKATGETTKPGSLTTWRAIGTNHHITFIVNLLSSQS